VNNGDIFNDFFILNLLLSATVKNFEDRLGFGKVMAKNKVAPFFRTRCRTHRLMTAHRTILPQDAILFVP